jgi:hypothetical protein
MTFFLSSKDFDDVSPHSRAVEGINCQSPSAFFGDLACGLFPLSMRGITARSMGNPSF